MAVVVVVAGLAVLVLVGLPTLVGLRLTHPKRLPVTGSPSDMGLAYRDVTFASRIDHIPLRGWWIPTVGAAAGTAVLAHGYASNRLIGGIGLPLAAYLHSLRWNVLMFDFRASGESGGTLVSIGEFETWDLLGAVDYARGQGAPGIPVVVLGYSMGASTALLAAERDPEIAGVLADSPFAALLPYLRANIGTWTHLPAPMNWVLLHVVPLITGIDPAAVDPLRGMGRLAGRPVLLIAGTADHRVPPSNAEELFAAAPPGTATLWLVPGAGHTGAWDLDRGSYEAHLRAWLHAVLARG